MCGIAGVLTPDGPVANTVATAQAMGAALAARGPDDAGIWSDGNGKIALAHRRLAVIDLSPAGHQPMHSRCGRYTIVFNGEIYNFPKLRQQLAAAGVRFVGHSDTETLLEAIASWGLTLALQRCNGCFALAVWDRVEQHLLLARDRIGEKPLYYGWVNGSFLFASELKALHACANFSVEIDREAVAQYLQFGYIPEPLSIYRNVRKLVPGSFIAVSARAPGVLPEPMPFWSLRAAVDTARSDLMVCSFDEAAAVFDAALQRAVALRMIADVPLGAFLSGGIDSSLMVAMMGRATPHPVRTFSIGFHEAAYNEAPQAAAIARHLGTDHTEFYVSAAEARAIIPRLPMIYDEPLADTSQIPTAVLSQLARQQVTVAMSGDGGDEVFGGYRRYRSMRRFWHLLGRCPAPARKLVGSALSALTSGALGSLVQGLAHTLPPTAGAMDWYDRVSKTAEFSRFNEPMQMYRRLIALWPQPELLLQNMPPVADREATLQVAGDARAFVDQMMYFDTANYLPGNILPKLDRASMACGLEARMPFLDHELIELAWRLPVAWKIRRSRGKIMLRELLLRHLPRGAFDRPKMGFDIPLGAWLRGPLREWAEHLLDPVTLRDGGIFHAEPIVAAWRAHCSGRRDLRYQLWAILMFQAWSEQWGTTRTGQGVRVLDTGAARLKPRENPLRRL